VIALYGLGVNPDTFNPRILFTTKVKYSEANKPDCHQHDYTTLIYILSGSCIYNISGTPYNVKKGSVVICNPGVYHEKRMIPGQDILEFHVGINNLLLEGLPKNHLIPEDIPPVINPVKYELDFTRCCNEILLEQEKSEPGRGLMLKSLVMKLIAILLKEIYTGESVQENSQVNFESSDRTNIVNTIISYLNDNYMKDISLDKISKNMYLSPAYISKVFKEEIGESPINYLIKVRLSKAYEMLKEGNLPIKAIAKNVGYDDAYYFSKLFKKYYSTPPSKYKVH
jgi:AraC-like DNA-binding protein